MSATADEQALLDEALRQADERLAASLQRDELRRRRRRWLALGGFAMTITVAGIVTCVIMSGQRAEPREARDVSRSARAKARELLRKGEALRKNGRLAEAELRFEAAVGHDPRSIEGWVELGWVCKNQGEYRGAEAAFKRCLKLDESCPNANNGLAWIYFNQREYATAERYWRKIASQPSVSRSNTPLSRGGAFSAKEGLARLCLLDGRFDEAAKWAQMVSDDRHESTLGDALLAAAKAKKLGQELRRKIEPLKVTELSPSRSFPLRDSFESGAAFGNAPAPYGWWRCGRVPGVEFIWDRAIGCDGKASLCLRKTAKRYFPIAQWCRTMEHTGGTGALRVSAQVKAERVTKAVIDVLCLGADGEWLGHKWAAYIGAKQGSDPPSNHDWKEYSGSVAIWPGTKRIVIGLQIYGPGTVWFDKLAAEYITGVDK